MKNGLLIFSLAVLLFSLPQISNCEDFRSLTFGPRLGSHIAMLEEWENQFEFVSGASSSTSMLLFGFELNYVTPSPIYFGAGFDYFLGKEVEIVDYESMKDRVTATYYYGTVGFQKALQSNPNVSLGGAVDIGYLNAKETVEMMGVSAEGTGSTMGIRPKFRFQRKFNKIDLAMDLGFLIANASEIEMGGLTIEDYELDISGLTLSISLLLPYWL